MAVIRSQWLNLAAYSRGVNEGLASLSRAPFEYSLLQIQPEPWLEADNRPQFTGAGKISATVAVGPLTLAIQTDYGADMKTVSVVLGFFSFTTLARG